MRLKQILVIICLLIIPLAVQAAEPNYCPTGSPADKVCLKNPLDFIGVKSPTDLIIKASQGLAAIVAAVAVAFLVFSGFKLVIATNEESIKSARESITWSIGGFGLSILAFTIISGAANLLGFTGASPNDTLTRCGFLTFSTNCFTASDFVGVLNNIMSNFLALTGVISVGMIIYYGFRYVVASGNEEALSSAKSGLMWSIVGLVIIVFAFAIINGVQKLLFGIT